MKDEKIPGMAIGIVKDDKVIYLKGFGIKKKGEYNKVDPNTVFQMASATKPVTGTVVAAAVSHGFLKWDDKLKDYIPNFKLKDDWVTQQFMVEDALAHRSGLKPFEGDLLEQLGYNLNEIIDRLQYAEPLSSFRTQYAYQNIIITLGGLAAANAAKKDFDQLAKQVLFKPLEMTNSGYFFKDFDEAKNKAYGHIKDKEGQWITRYLRHADTQFGGGGLSSTAQDMANWMIMYLNDGKFKDKEIINKNDLEKAHTPHIFRDEKEGASNFYGLGMVVSYDYKNGYRTFYHDGAFTTGNRSMILLLPDEKLGIVILANAFPSGLPEGLGAAARTLYLTGNKNEASAVYKKTNELMMQYLAVYLKKSYSKNPTKSEISLPLENYEGNYKNNYYDSLEIKKVGDHLVGYIGKHRANLHLKHITANTFNYEFKTIDREENTGLLTFEMGKDNKAKAVKLTGFENGDFKKI